MANKIILKKSSVGSKVPLSTDLDYGELALNYTDGKLYYKKSDGTTIDYFTSGEGTNSGNISTIIDRKLYTVSSAGLNSFAVAYQINLTVAYVDVFVNGVRLNSTEYTATNGSTVSISSLSVGDEVQLVGYRNLSLGDITTKYFRETYTASAGQTTFAIEYSIINGATLSTVQVFVNGVLLDTAEYSAASGTDIILVTPANAGDIVECFGYKDVVLTSDPTSFVYDTFTGNGSTTSYTLSANSATNNSSDIYVDRVYQVPGVDYNITGSTLTFTSAPSSGSEITARTLTGALNLINSPTVYWSEILAKPDFATVAYVDNAVSNVQVDLTGYATETYVNNAVANVQVDLTGYATETYVTNSLSSYATVTYTNAQLATKQSTLVSGTNIKTINGYSILGPGDLTVASANQSLNTTDSVTFNNITSTGTVTAVNFNSTSDIRFKKDIVRIENALQKIEDLTGYTFTMIENDMPSTGLLAHDVERVMPQAIGGDENKKTVAYGNLIGLVVEAIKELKQEVEQLKSEIRK